MLVWHAFCICDECLMLSSVLSKCSNGLEQRCLCTPGAVVRLLKEGSAGEGVEQVAPGFWLVEAIAMATEGQHAAAAAAIGKLAELLEPLVVLQKQ